MQLFRLMIKGPRDTVQGPASPFRVPRPHKSHTIRSRGEYKGRSVWAMPMTSALGAASSAHAPRKQRGELPCLPAWLPMLAFSEASSLVQVLGRTRSKKGRRPKMRPAYAGFPG